MWRNYQIELLAAISLRIDPRSRSGLSEDWLASFSHASASIYERATRLVAIRERDHALSQIGAAHDDPQRLRPS